MQTINEDTKESHRNVYETSQIKVGFMFDDGPVMYFDDMIPKLDRESLGWNASLVNKSIKATWMVRRVKTFFTGKVVSYNDESQKHTVKWAEDNTTNEFDVMGRWHEGMLPILEWRLLCEDELPAPGGNKELSARGKRAANKEPKASNTDSRSATPSCVTIPSAKRAKQCQGDKCRGQRGRTKNGRVPGPLSKNIAHIDAATCEREKKRASLLTQVKKELCCLSPESWLGDSIIEYCLMMVCDRNFEDSLGALTVLKEWDVRDRINSMGLTKDMLDFGVLRSFLIAAIEQNSTCYEKGVMPPHHSSADEGQWHIFCGGPDKLCEFLLFPINFGNSHWSLGIVCQTQNVILHLDSSSDMIDVESVEAKCRAIRIYLNSISSKQFTEQSLPLIRVDVPQQTNGYDCGMFLLHYAMLFITSDSKQKLAHDLCSGKKRKWFKEDFPCSLRKNLLELMTLQTEGLPEEEENEARLNGASLSEEVRQKIQDKVWGSNVAHGIQLEDSSESGSDEDSMLTNDERMQKLEDALRKRCEKTKTKTTKNRKEGGPK
jgi:hypothetical protein